MINKKNIENKTNNLQDICDHKDYLGNYTIKYDSSYEMRSNEMHCTQCFKSGSREELTGKDVIF